MRPKQEATCSEFWELELRQACDDDLTGKGEHKSRGCWGGARNKAKAVMIPGSYVVFESRRQLSPKTCMFCWVRVLRRNCTWQDHWAWMHTHSASIFSVQDRAASVRQGRTVQQVKYSKARKGQAVQRGQGQAVSAVAASTMFEYPSQELGQQLRKKLRRSRQAHCKRPS